MASRKSKKKTSKKSKKKVTKKKSRPVRKTKKRAGKKAGKKKSSAKKKKKSTRAVAKPAKKSSAKKTAAIKRAVTAVKERMIGKVVHYYDRIGVAIVDLESPLKVGDTIRMKRGDTELVQQVSSMQIEHQTVANAKRGDVIGMKVDRETPVGTVVVPV